MSKLTVEIDSKEYLAERELIKVASFIDKHPEAELLFTKVGAFSCSIGGMMFDRDMKVHVLNPDEKTYQFKGELNHKEAEIKRLCAIIEDLRAQLSKPKKRWWKK